MPRIIEHVIVAVAAAAILAIITFVGRNFLGDWLLKEIDGVSKSDMKQEIQRLKTSVSIPTGAILAFDLPGGCNELDGWSEFREGWGLTIVGAVPPPETDDVSLGKYAFRTRKGVEEIVLGPTHLPKHAHEYIDVFWSEHDISRPKQSTVRVEVPDNRGAKSPWDDDNVGWGRITVTDSTGENASHTNMQPYLALYFCKKDALSVAEN